MAEDPVDVAKVQRLLEAVLPPAAIMGPWPNRRDPGWRVYLVFTLSEEGKHPAAALSELVYFKCRYCGVMIRAAGFDQVGSRLFLEPSGAEHNCPGLGGRF